LVHSVGPQSLPASISRPAMHRQQSVAAWQTGDREETSKMNKITQRIGIGIVSAALALASFAAPAVAAGNGTDHFGPFLSTSPDGGSCGVVPWATDTFNRFFTVHDNGDGTFAVREDFKDGAFTTIGTVSPGQCDATNHHGTTVPVGITGSFQGFLAGTVTSSIYTPAACSSTTNVACSTTAGFVATTFGPGATFNTTSFNFEYNSSDQSLQYHHWQDKSADKGAGEQFIGDIASQ
jgi:hypothetical protein